jgi:hypothetical protein
MMTFIKRRLSVDTPGETESQVEQSAPVAMAAPPTPGNVSQIDKSSFPTNFNRNPSQTAAPSQSIQQQQPKQRQSGPSPSAPSSPTKTMSFSAMFSMAKDTLATNATALTTGLNQNIPGTGLFRQSNQRSKTLFVIDESNVDWSKYFRNRKIGDTDIRVEQVCALFAFLYHFWKKNKIFYFYSGRV